MARSYAHSSHWGAFTVETEQGKLRAVQPFERDPSPSPLIHAIPEWVHHQSRVARPSVRKGWLGKDGGAQRGMDAYIEMPWDEVLDIVAAEVGRVASLHGNSSIFAGSYGWASAGRFHHPKTQLQRYLALLGGFTGQTYSYSVAAAYAILPHIVGSSDSIAKSTTSWNAIGDYTKLLVAFGGLPLKNHQVVSGGPGIHSAEQSMRAAKAKGVRFVNISPLKTDMPDFADSEWLPIRPGTDTAMMLAMAHRLMTTGSFDRDFIERCTVGWAEFEAYVMGRSDGLAKDTEWAASITGLPAGRIASLADEMAQVPTLLSTNWSLQRADHGEQPFWGTIALAAMLGGIGRPGEGFAFGYGSIAGMGEARTPIPAITMKPASNPARSSIPVARIADMLLDPGGGYHFNGQAKTYPDVRLVYWCGGNPFHHHQDINRLIQAWRKPETVVVHEPWWSTVAKFADIVLPATTTLERNDIGSSSKDRCILAMKKAIPPLGEARNDYDIFVELARRAGHEDAFTEGLDEEGWLKRIYSDGARAAAARGVQLPTFEQFWGAGHVEVAPPADEKPMFADFRSDPGSHPLRTPSGRIEIFSKTVASFSYADCPGHPVWLAPKEWLGDERAKQFPLHLITNQPKFRLHSQLDQTAISLASKIRGREPACIHPADAAARGIGEGHIIEIFNDRGRILAGAVLCQDVLPGVIQMATGAWYDPDRPGEANALDKHGNPNVLTADRGTSSLGQGPSALSALVDIRLHGGAEPPVTAFDPPRFEHAK